MLCQNHATTVKNLWRVSYYSASECSKGFDLLRLVRLNLTMGNTLLLPALFCEAVSEEPRHNKITYQALISEAIL